MALGDGPAGKQFKLQAQVVRVSLGYTYNLGDYESRRIDLTAEITYDTTLSDIFIHLQQMLDDQNDRLQKARRTRRR